jgi:two-component system sensor histidine kinase and response regulator WspE
MKETVTEISGRVGLDVVRSMVRTCEADPRLYRAGQGTRFQLQLPLTLSVVRTLLVEIGGEPYAFRWRTFNAR